MLNNYTDAVTTTSKIAVRFGDAVLQEGFTSVPNLVLNHYASLGITANEMMFTIHIWQYWWTEKDPYPSLKKIAEKMNASLRQVRRYVESLKSKKYLIVRERHIPELGQLTNEYDFSPLIKAVVEKAEGTDSTQPPTPRSDLSEGGVSEMSGVPRSRMSAEKYEDKKDKEQEDIYPSNIRKANSDEFDEGSPNDSAEQATEGDSLTHNEEVEHSQSHSSTNGRNIEENEKYKHFVRKQNTRSSPAALEPTRTSGVTHIGQTLQGRLAIASPTVPAVEARDAIERLIRDTAAKLHDEAPLKSSTTRAFNLYQRSGVDLGTFYTLMYDAEKEANRRSATIKKVTTQGYKNRMVYFFALLEDKLGLKQSTQKRVD